MYPIIHDAELLQYDVKPDNGIGLTVTIHLIVKFKHIKTTIILVLFLTFGTKWSLLHKLILITAMHT